jgi:large subunit ribosomal protein L6
MVVGVSEGFTKTLEIVGVGYRAELKGTVLNLSLGYSHPVTFDVPAGISVEVIKGVTIKISGYDKQAVGQFAADIRSKREPEPYHGKGIHYSDEVVRRKEGKTAKK